VAAEAALIGAEVSEGLCARTAEASLADAAPLRQKAYKVPMAKALIRRGLTTPHGEGDCLSALLGVM